jgi:hypothetical protein
MSAFVYLTASKAIFFDIFQLRCLLEKNEREVSFCEVGCIVSDIKGKASNVCGEILSHRCHTACDTMPRTCTHFLSCSWPNSKRPNPFWTTSVLKHSFHVVSKVSWEAISLYAASTCLPSKSDNEHSFGYTTPSYYCGRYHTYCRVTVWTVIWVPFHYRCEFLDMKIMKRNKLRYCFWVHFKAL